MTPESKLPSLGFGDATADRVSHGSLEDPRLFDGLIVRRAVAYGLDVLLIGVLYACVWVAVALAGVLTFGLATPFGLVALGLLPLAYHTFFLGRQGATPGMRLLDLEVHSCMGRRLDYFQAFLMTVLFYVSVALTAWLILAVALFNDRRRTLHDSLSGTLVVRRSRL